MTPEDNFIPTGLPGGFFIYNAEGDQEILFADQNVIDLFDCKTIAELRAFTHNSFLGMVHPDDLTKVQHDINAQTFNSEKRHDYVRYRILTKTGRTRYIEDFGHLLHGVDGKKYFYVYIVDTDANEFYNQNCNSLAESQVLSEMSTTDRLTGLLNMRTFYTKAEELFADPERRGCLVFAHFDIVNFKHFNEEHGFQRGDDLLCRLAFVLRNTFPNALASRFSNDHFVVLDTTSVDAMKVHVIDIHNTMEKILMDARVDVKGGIYALEDSCSEVGVACDRARLACNTVKHRYDRVFGIYDAQLYERLRLQQYVIDTVDDAIANGYIEVYYQPTARVATKKVCGCEALARWDDPLMGYMPPSRFIATLEEFHMIHKVDCFVLEHICQDLARLKELGEPVVPVSVNLSRLDFDACDIFEICEGHLAAYGIDRSLIDIEITESSLNDDFAHLTREISRFRNAGYRIWVDDFGSGYSALNSLLDYDFDVLKLDLEFLRTYDEHPKAQELISHMVQVARGLGVEPLQEGVERPNHLELLEKLGCEMAQGYYFARPMQLNELRDHIRSIGLGWESASEREARRAQEAAEAQGEHMA